MLTAIFYFRDYDDFMIKGIIVLYMTISIDGDVVLIPV